MESCRFLGLILVFTMIFSGCGQKRPDGMPELYKTKIILTQQGKPCADAKIALISLGGSQWSSGGTTDANGGIELVTHGQYKGVPAGKYRVTVDKTVGEGEPPPPSPIDAESQRIYNEYVAAKKSYRLFQVIPDQYRLRDRSPLEIEVVAGKNEITLDIPEEIKVEIKSSGLR